MKIKKSVTLKPILLAEVLMVVVLASAGAAMAFTNGSTVSDSTSISPVEGIQYTQAIGDSDNLVTDYAFTYNTDLDEISAVTGNLSGTVGDKCYVTVVIGDADLSPSETKKSDLVTFAGATASFTCTLGDNIAISSVTQVNFLVEKTLDA
jgi:hypothetical protein